MTTALEARELTVRYGGVRAVDGFSFRVEPGTVVGLIGPNGAGKTSLIDAVTGFTKSSGAVVFDGEDISGLRPHLRARRGIARSWQSLELFDDLTVDENLRLARGHMATGENGEPQHRADVLASLGLAGFGDRLAGDLSQGQRKLVALARALAARPKILLADEPAAGLDSAESLELGERLRSFTAGGLGVLLIDHDMSLVLGVCDYIYVIDFGRPLAEGTPDAVRTNRLVIDAYLGKPHDEATDEEDEVLP